LPKSNIGIDLFTVFLIELIQPGIFRRV